MKKTSPCLKQVPLSHPSLASLKMRKAINQDKMRTACIFCAHSQQTRRYHTHKGCANFKQDPIFVLLDGIPWNTQ